MIFLQIKKARHALPKLYKAFDDDSRRPEPMASDEEMWQNKLSIASDIWKYSTKLTFDLGEFSRIGCLLND